jgi:hypothetical protein
MALLTIRRRPPIDVTVGYPGFGEVHPEDIRRAIRVADDFAGVRTSRTVVGAALTSAWTDDDLVTLAEIARKNRILDPDYLLRVLASESGLLPNAAYRDSSGYPVAVGLNQLTSVANGVVGITEEERKDIPNWSVSEQLPLIDKMFAAQPWNKAGHDYDSAAAVYEANFAPGRMLSRGTSYDTKLYEQGVDGAAYDQNKGLDYDKKGYITVGDLARRLDFVATLPTYQEALGRLRAVGGTPSNAGWSWWKYAILGLFAAGIGVVAVVR